MAMALKKAMKRPLKMTEPHPAAVTPIDEK
jgi:hypothetical protein